MRTAVYIDGFNFYYGAVKDTTYKWLDPKQLCETILKPHHDIISIVYCMAKVRPKPQIRVPPYDKRHTSKPLSRTFLSFHYSGTFSGNQIIYD